MQFDQISVLSLGRNGDENDEASDDFIFERQDKLKDCEIGDHHDDEVD